MKILSISCALIMLGCGSAEYQRATSHDTEAGYRALLADHPDDEDADGARERLRSLAFQRATRGDDVASYNRFLAEFPEGDFATEARERRARARLRRALDDGDAEGLRQLIESDPRSRAAERARQRLEQLEAAEATTTDEPDRLRAFLLAFPQSDSREEIERRLDDLEFASANESDHISTFQQYIDDHPRGVHRAEALERIEALEADQIIATDRPEDMERYIRRHPGSSAEERVRRALAKALVQSATLFLDERMARRALSLEPEAEVAEDASELIKSWVRGGRRLAQERELISEMAGPLEVREAEELRDSLSGSDPIGGWNAVREVALSRDTETLDVAIEAAGSGDPLLLFYARIALASRTGEAEQRDRTHLGRWLERLRRRSSNPEDMLRIGAVSEALGEHEAALRAYRRASQHRATHLAGVAHWAILAAEHAPPDERDEAAQALAEAGRTRTEELLDLIPEEIDIDRLEVALRVLRGLEALQRVIERASDRLAPIEADGIEIPEPEARDDLSRLARALAATSRRLLAQLQLEDPTIRAAGEQDHLARAAAERRARRLEAARRLGTLRATRAIPALHQVAGRDEGELGREALRSLARMRSAEARSALLQLAQDQASAPANQLELARALRDAAQGTNGETRRQLLDEATRLESSGAPTPTTEDESS